MRRLPVLLVALALLAPACSAFGAAPAATVDGTKISATSVDDEIKVIRANSAYRKVLEQSYGQPTGGTAGSGTFNAAFVAQILSLRVWYTKIQHDLDKRGLHVTADVTAQAKSDIQQQFSQLGPKVFAKFPAKYRDELIRQRALVSLIDQDISTKIGVDPKAFYDANKDQFAEICISHALVGTQSGRTPAAAKAKAQRLYDDISSGRKTFEDVATKESDDTAAAKGGGAVGCGTRTSLQLDPTFLTAAFALRKGVVSKPVQTQFGSHLILVTSRTIPSYESVQSDVQTVMQQTHDQRINAYLARVICGGKVDVNPRYGTWDRSACKGAAPQLPSVKPPPGPKGATSTTTSVAVGQN